MLSVYSRSGEFYLYSFQPLGLSVLSSRLICFTLWAYLSQSLGLFASAFRLICTDA